MRRSLRGQQIVVTRAAHQAEELAGPLRELGAEPILLPLIGIAPPDDKTPLLEAAAHADAYDWIVFTSANAITAFVAELPDTGEWFRPRIATIGPATREVAEEYGFRVELTPEKYIAESLAEAFRPHPLDGKRILIPTAAVTRDIVPAELRKRGAEVDVVPAYQNVIPHEAPQRAHQIFQSPLPDWVTFASSSAAEHLVALVPMETLREIKIASIGPATSATVLNFGLTVTAEGLKHTIPGLIEAMLTCR
jgi:uroporphyrinogen III methyltransferase/synthase